VYIERERVRERVPPPAPEYDTYRYVPGTGGGDDIGRRRSRSITYETNPRNSGRMVERERVVVEDNGRRREYVLLQNYLELSVLETCFECIGCLESAQFLERYFSSVAPFRQRH
jgi:hypothetical protein